MTVQSKNKNKLKIIKGESYLSQNDKLLYSNFNDFESFFANLYKFTFDYLYSYGMQFCGNKDLVKDSIQDLFSELWNNEKVVKKIQLFKPYLLRCVRNKIKKQLGKGYHLKLEEGFQIESSYELKMIQDQQDTTKGRALKKALDTLTKKQREAIYLKFYGDLSYDEVAQVLNITTKGSYKLIYRALSSLKETMPDFNL